MIIVGQVPYVLFLQRPRQIPVSPCRVHVRRALRQARPADPPSHSPGREHLLALGASQWVPLNPVELPFLPRLGSSPALCRCHRGAHSAHAHVPGARFPHLDVGPLLLPEPTCRAVPRQALALRSPPAAVRLVETLGALRLAIPEMLERQRRRHSYSCLTILPAVRLVYYYCVRTEQYLPDTFECRRGRSCVSCSPGR
jgi:hypothetical protein